MDTDNTMDHNTMDHEDDLMWGSAPTVTSRDLLSFDASTNSHSSTDTLQVVMIKMTLEVVMIILIMIMMIMGCRRGDKKTKNKKDKKTPTLRRTPWKLSLS